MMLKIYSLRNPILNCAAGKIEIASIEEQIPALEETIKLLLIPADPADGRNAMLEIRAGTGGDEAALFAGDLLKMYAHYIESRH